MAKELKRGYIEFSYKLISVIPEDIIKDPIESIRSRKMELFIVVKNSRTGDEVVWDVEKFNDRLISIRDLYNLYLDGLDTTIENPDEDPFYEPPQPQLIG